MYDFMNFVSDNADKKNPLLVTSSMIQHPTGFMYLDYGVGNYMTVYDDNEDPLYTYHNIGITSGSVNVVISKSQGGKTTLCIEMLMAIIEPFINQMYYAQAKQDIMKMYPKEAVNVEYDGAPMIQILDTEKTLPAEYVKKLVHYPNKLMKRHVMINPITTDKDLIAAVEKHIAYKTQHMKPELMPMLDMYGKPMYQYAPTGLIIDSMSQLLLEEVDDPAIVKKKGGLQDLYESATKGPAGAQRAKIISALYSQLVNYAKRYNIIIFSINHINKMPAIMGIPVKQYRGLRAGETIGGGERAIYLASNILRLDVIKNIGGQSSTSVQLGEGITGHVAIASWIKSKSNSRSNNCQLVYTNQNGYDQLMSSIWFSKENGDLAKSGNFYYVNGYPEYKFTLKTATDTFAEHPELFGAYYDQLRDCCSKMLDNPDNAMKNNQKLMESIRDDIYNDDDYSHNDMMDIDDIFQAATMEG